ncbi:sterol desaturase family protein [Pseudomonas sp. J452]|uniref:sterol desaturase family protein n=1 Tax=Pseudomonas sp. J452 TaxID=2898441 RepID=UPI0021AD7835|nr:sterol desaturase family protein [Pseudomonas sp. J452]UUY08301.1 sterol desaturase family protein [Pseudomonas sp. J452]
MEIGLSVFMLLLLLDFFAGEFRKPHALSMNELGVNLISTAIAFTIRAIPFAAIMFVLVHGLPGLKGVLAESNVWLVFLVILLVDDYGNYWLHRSAHKVPWLWRLHKPHHIPTQMNVLMGVRENLFYYFLLPVNIMAPLLVFMGAEEAGALMLALKLTVVYLQHASYRWDLWLRRSWLGGVLLDGLENLFALQDFHHVHHGIGRYGNASSNYGNVLNIWDDLHGTNSGHPRRPQDAYGLPVGVKVESWAVQLFWPLLREKQTQRAVAPALTPSSAAELAEARAVIHTADGVAVAVR